MYDIVPLVQRSSFELVSWCNLGEVVVLVDTNVEDASEVCRRLDLPVLLLAGHFSQELSLSQHPCGPRAHVGGATPSGGARGPVGSRDAARGTRAK